MQKLYKTHSITRIQNTFILFSLLYLYSISNYAQEISPRDQKIISEKSRMLVKDLSVKINLILAFELSERKTLIDNLVLPASNGLLPMFLDEDVIIEDDFSTYSGIANSEKDKKVEQYLLDIGANYGLQDNGDNLNEGKEVKFQEIVTKLTQLNSKTSDTLFSEVYFSIKYDGVHSKTQKKFIQPCKRVAELIAIKKNGIWQVSIRAIRFYENKSNVKPIDNKPKIAEEEKKIVESKPSPTLNNYPTDSLLWLKPAKSLSKPISFKKVVAAGLILYGIVSYLVISNNHTKYVDQIEKNNSSYTAWYSTAYGSNANPPSEEIVKPNSIFNYAPLGIGTSLAGFGTGLTLFFSKKSKKVTTVNNSKVLFSELTIKPIINMQSFAKGLSITYSF